MPEPPRRGVHDRRAPRLAEDSQELERLPPDPPELERFLHDERPAHDGEDHEHEENDLGDRAGVPDEGHDPELSESLGTGAPFVCVQNSYGIITTSVGRAVVLPLLLAVIGVGASVAVAQEGRGGRRSLRLPGLQRSDR